MARKAESCRRIWVIMSNSQPGPEKLSSENNPLNFQLGRFFFGMCRGPVGIET